MARFHIYARIDTRKEGWTSVKETPTFQIEADDEISACLVAFYVVTAADDSSTTFVNLFVVDGDVYTRRKVDNPEGPGKVWGNLRRWDASKDLN